MKILETRTKKFEWLFDLILILILLTAAFLRLRGSDWGDLQYQHPDELFIEGVTYAIAPLFGAKDNLGAPPTAATQQWRAAYPEEYPDCTEWGGYFDTACSPFNPHNVGKSFYVYGTLPIFIVRGLADILHQGNNLQVFGRQMSALADLGTIALLYFIVKRVYKQRVAILAALFSAFAVMQIQQSHFYTTDNFAVFFVFLTIFFAVELAFGGKKKLAVPEPVEEPAVDSKRAQLLSDIWRFIKTRDFLFSLLFGLALGMAMASKINTAPLGALLPLAFLVRDWRSRKELAEGQPAPDWSRLVGYVVIGAVFTLLSFRIFQPYAFTGLFSFSPQWLSNMAEVRGQASPNSDLGWNLQWINRSNLYSFENLTTWGLGLPLGILAWAGFLWMAWRSLRGEWRQHLLLWSWTAVYFAWQSIQYNPTMRYQLPIYPLLAMMAAWLLVWLWDKGKELSGQNAWSIVLRLSSAFLGIVVLGLTAAWAFAFSGIYTRPETRVAASSWIFQNVGGPINLHIQTPDGSTYQQPLPFYSGSTFQTDAPYLEFFQARVSGALTEVRLPHVLDTSLSGVQTLTVSLYIDPAQVLVSGSVTADFSASGDGRGESYTLTLDQPLVVEKDTTYGLRIETTGGVITLGGDTFANEANLDWPLPFRISGYDPFGGLYRGDLYMNVYDDDNADKLAHMLSVLDQADYIFIPTNHQYAQITRLPIRYPLTTEYYRQLIGCPEGENIIECYRLAQPGTYQGNLGFELVAVFESYATLGPVSINDGSAEEAFTFYDHPKVLIFHKTADYDPARVAAILGAVDLSNAAHYSPTQLENYKTLMLSDEALSAQQSGGTWSDLFDYEAIQNRYPGFGIVLWYLFTFFVGLLAYPLVRAAFPGLSDRGYPLARIVGLLLWAWLAWMAGSIGLTYTRPVIAAALGVVALLGAWQAWRQRDELKQEFRQNWKYFLLAEAVFLAFFLLDLGIRLGNPDLWHPAKGGERPMDFAYLNAVLKSTSFPPYDPWYAGGYINYYYFGYVIVGTPVKLLGIVPSIAYNFILPTLYAMLALAAFSVAWNLLDRQHDSEGTAGWLASHRLPLFGGLSASAAMVLLGNLGIVRMFVQGFQKIGSPAGIIEGANIFEKTWWGLKGFVLALVGANLPYGIGNWYWDPSRIMPPNTGDPITEFPLFTFIYSDLHAHMIALMLTVLVIAWAVSVLLSKARWKTWHDAAFGLFLGGLAVGALRPTNTWDFYTYLILSVVVLVYSLLRYADVDSILPGLPVGLKRTGLAVAGAVALAGLAFVLYQPFSDSFAQAYNSVELWKGGRSNISSYLVHWGTFLFFITSWLVWETRQWMAETPVSALRKLRPYRELIYAGLGLILIVLIFQQVTVMSDSQNNPWMGITIVWLALPLALWAAILLFRPGISDGKRLVLFMVGTSLLLTMVVEFIVLRGDIGRMNTVFKFYLQAWSMLGVSAAAAFGWLMTEFRYWRAGWRTFWTVTATALATGALLFLIIGGADKIRDRWNTASPRSLDSMDYMAYIQHSDYGATMTLAEDFRAIRWMQENVQGSPVIIEAAPAGQQYRWLGRFSIYTGLPSVVGWEWHQIQQRAFFSSQVILRGIESNQFYATTDIDLALAFLEKYDVEYIIVGQLERAKYAPGAPDGPVLSGEPDGLPKFEQYNGIYWDAVYTDGQTTIYQVRP